MNFYKKKSKSFSKLNNVILAVLFVVLSFCVYKNYTEQFVVSSDANTEGKFITIQSRVDGMVAQVYVEKDLEVKKGDLLLEIDSTVYRQELQRKQAELNKLKTKLYFKEHKFEEKENPTIISDENKKIEEEEEVFPKSRYSDYSKMYDKEIVHLQNKYRKAKIDEESEEDGDGDGDKNKDKTTIDDIQRAIKETELQISDIKLAISYTKVYATQDGLITDISVSDGDYVEVSQNLLSIIPKMVWIIANFPADSGEDIAPGQFVKIEINGFKRKKFKGIVDGVSQNDREQFGIRTARIVFTEDYTDYNIEPGKFAVCYVKVR